MSKIETEMEELPELSVGSVVCKNYEGPGNTGGAAHFPSGGANNVEFVAVADNPVQQEQPVDAHEDKGAKMETEMEELPKLSVSGVVQ
jgi:hypothetical protein